VASRLNRAEIWLLERPRPDKRRPVLILSRPSLIAALDTVTVAGHVYDEVIEALTLPRLRENPGAHGFS